MTTHNTPKIITYVLFRAELLLRVIRLKFNYELNFSKFNYLSTFFSLLFGFICYIQQFTYFFAYNKSLGSNAISLLAFAITRFDTRLAILERI